MAAGSSTPDVRRTGLASRTRKQHCPPMRHTSLAVLTASVALSAALWLGGCDNRPFGFTYYDGEQYSLTAENTRLIRQRMVVAALKPKLGDKWRAEAVITELPKWDPDKDRYEWERATVTVDLIGDGTTPIPLPTHVVQGLAYEEVKGAVWRPRSNLTVTVKEVSDATRFAAPTAPTPIAPATVAALTVKPANAPSSYVIQAGDTLMQISAAAYGSSKHWRRILDANPGLDPSAMPVGKAIMLPVLTDAPGNAVPPAAKPTPGGS